MRVNRVGIHAKFPRSERHFYAGLKGGENREVLETRVSGATVAG